MLAVEMIDIGQVVGNYKVTSKLGEGGMGVVYLAEHPVIGRRAALKAIHPQFSGNGEVVTRFINEARSISQIGHDHIVDVTDFGRTDAGDFYLIMEYLAGETLSDRLALEAPFAPVRALQIAAQIADAIAASHSRGVIHRDLKPENVILIDRRGTRDFVKVLDFGLAKLAGDGAEARAAQNGMIMGTPYYMAPEQCQARGLIDERTDIYALGVILFEMLTGRVPFGGDSSREVLRKQVSMRAPTVRSYRPDLPEVLDVLLGRALAKKPSERFPSMSAFREALLFPMKHAGAAPVVSALDDLSDRGRTSPKTLIRGSGSRGGRSTLGGGAGEIIRQAQTVVDLVPARSRRGAWLAVVAAAVAGASIVVGVVRSRPSVATASVIYDSTTPTPPPELVRVTFASDPHGVTVVDGAGRTLGTTPLSIEVPKGDLPVEYKLRREGFAEKTMSLIPNISTPVFAVMQAEPAPKVVAPTVEPDSAAPTAEPDKEEPKPQRARGRRSASRHAANETTIAGPLPEPAVEVQLGGGAGAPDNVIAPAFE
jgi:serine/threonine-protein kinase